MKSNDNDHWGTNLKGREDSEGIFNKKHHSVCHTQSNMKSKAFKFPSIKPKLQYSPEQSMMQNSDAILSSEQELLPNSISKMTHNLPALSNRSPNGLNNSMLEAELPSPISMPVTKFKRKKKPKFNAFFSDPEVETFLASPREQFEARDILGG